MLARASLGKESSVNAKTAASKAEAQPRSREREQFLQEFTPPKFSWNIGNITMSAPGDGGRPNQGENGAPGGPAWHFARPLPLPIQSKLEVGATDDPLEREADRVAEQVMRIPDPRATNSGTPRSSSALQKASPTELDATVQHKPAAPQVSRAVSSPIGSGMTAPPIVHEVLSSPGHPLDAATRAFMEPRFGHDLSRVCIHADVAAARSAREVNALAYTVGNHIVFGEGQFAPNTHEGRQLLGHELAHLVQQSQGEMLIQRQPDKSRSKTQPSRAPAPSTSTLPQFVSADQVEDLKRIGDEDWEIVLSGHTSENSAMHVIFPTRVPPSVKIQLQIAFLEPLERGTFKLSGIRFDSLKLMEPSIAKVFVAHGLEDETKERTDVLEARAAFRKRHEDHGEWVLNAIDVALKRATKRNPDLLVAYYRHYADHQLADPSRWDKFWDNINKGDLGATNWGDTLIQPDVFRLESKAPSEDPLSLLGGTLIHEFSHSPQGGRASGVEQAPKEAKAYGIELFFAERMGDKRRANFIYKRSRGDDPVDLKTSGNEIFSDAYTIISALYALIDQGGPEAEKARKMSVEFISKNPEDYGPELKGFIQKVPGVHR
jgi:hypothetical protein